MVLLRRGRRIQPAVFALVALFIFLAPVRAIADDSLAWTPEDITLQVIYTTLHLADWSQTRTIAKNPDIYHEHNPFLGSHPSVHDVDNLFAMTLIAQFTIAHYLGHPARQWWQVAGIFLEAMMVANNRSIGIRFDF